MVPEPPLSRTKENISRIARLENEFLENRTLADRITDAIADFVGSIRFVAIHMTWFVLWVSINSRFSPLYHFDPYPFMLLGQIVSVEAVLLSTFVLMKQNRMSRRADQREQLHLQINLLAEQEATKVLQLQRLICIRLGIVDAVHDQEIKELARDTAVEELAETLQREMPD